ncbi:hypothetical protein Q5R05_01915 [Leuconostoc carnosum]|uniref:hypothetical protein n=1 Tax=Leuconostoc carnosum TaxID=1252 RepID=UPI000D508524|nr:hypothetical protein [Leuconostoc carnosum]WLC58803.1 hypothetical protein HTZ88_01900 [Leuconostoc carnosum]WLC98142.1 hypothetical protein Q5R05_01915 [Leuconostoc carnosum]SPJ44059.1 conserved hypothetical protein [Leuconostoc carnosum]
MIKYSLIIDGKNVKSDFTLPFNLQVGDLINSSSDAKTPYYLIKGIVMSINDEFVQLHVDEFSNKVNASINIDWFN